MSVDALAVPFCVVLFDLSSRSTVPLPLAFIVVVPDELIEPEPAAYARGAKNRVPAATTVPAVAATIPNVLLCAVTSSYSVAFGPSNFRFGFDLRPAPLK